MFNDVNEAAAAFEDAMDDSGLMPGDEGFSGELDTPEQDLADRLEEDFQEEAGDEDEDDTEDEASDEGDSEEEGESDPDEDVDQDEASQLFDIVIDGEEYEVNLPELQAGYLRNEDLVKRTSELEDRVAQREAELAQKEAELVREIEATAVISTADLRQYENIDWARLKAENPEEYQSKRLEYVERRDEIQRQLSRRSQVQAMQEKAADIKHQAYLTAQFELVQKLVPEFAEQDYKSKILAYAESVGFTKEEIMGIADAKHILMLDQARKYAESQVRKKAVIAKKAKQELPEVIKPSARAKPATTESKRMKAQAERFKQSGSISDAAALFENFV